MLNRFSFKFAASILIFSALGCGREPSRLLRQGQLPIYDFPLYVSEAGTGFLVRFDKNGTKTTVLTGLNNPQGITTDRYNNIYVVERGAGRLVKVHPTNGTSTVLVSGLANPTVVAVDSVGEVYVSQDTPRNILRVGDLSVVATYSDVPNGLAFGVSDVFLVGFNATSTVKWGTTASAPGVVLTYPVVNVGVDGNGRVYAVEQDANFGTVRRFNQNQPDGQGTVVANLLKAPTGLAVDPVGNIYVIEQGKGEISYFGQDGTRATFTTGIVGPEYMSFTQY